MTQVPIESQKVLEGSSAMGSAERRRWHGDMDDGAEKDLVLSTQNCPCNADVRLACAGQYR